MTITELQDLVDRYLRLEADILESELARYRDQPTLLRAVELAATGADENGRMYDHQHRVGRSVFAAARRILVGMIDRYHNCTTFDELYDLIRNATRNVSRFGPLATYDTALRIGAKLRLSPRAVYLHCGSLEGARNLCLPRRHGRVKIDNLPPPLRENLTADQVETFLCRYKDRLSPVFPVRGAY